MFHVDKR